MSKELHADYVYHVSPFGGLGKLRPTGGHKGTQPVSTVNGGVYVAPKFRDALAWYASFVRHKKHVGGAHGRYRSEKGPNRGCGQPAHYQGATIYKLAVPKGMLKNLWWRDFWEPEYFIPGELMVQVRIVSAKTYSDSHLLNLYDRSRNKEWESRRGRWDTERLARDLRKNVAAQMWLSLLEEFRRQSLSRQTFDDVPGQQFQKGECATWRQRQQVFVALMNKMEEFFLVRKFMEPPVPITRCQDVEGAEKLASRIRLLLATTLDTFRWWDWRRDMRNRPA